MSRTDVLLIYPQLGSWDEVVRDIPLSLIYAATHTVKSGYSVKILDLRLYGQNWQDVIDSELKKGCQLVGLSVMTGNPITTSLKISRYIKENYDVTIVWGGPHPTILPDQTLENPAIDFVIRDWGSEALCQLVQHLKGKSIQKEDITGLVYKENGRIHKNTRLNCFEMIDFRDIPYHLVDISGNNYSRLKNGELVFPIYTSMGCPWNCTFCMSPLSYASIKGKKWIAYDNDYILDQIEYLAGCYQIGSFQDYADESFVDLDRMYNFFVAYIKRGFNKRFKLDFRGVRINDLDRMDDEYLGLVVRAGVRMIFIGMESGSNRILKFMRKGITTDQIVRVNRKLAKHPAIEARYNLFFGIPGENMVSLNETKKVMLQMIKDNPKLYMDTGGDWKPFPGTVAAEVAVKEYGLNLPANLEGWAIFDSWESERMSYPWYTLKMKAMMRLLSLTSMLLDGKTAKFSSNLGPVLGRGVYFLILLYRPFLRMRLKFNITSLLFEEKLARIGLKHLGKLLQSSKNTAM